MWSDVIYFIYSGLLRPCDKPYRYFRIWKHVVKVLGVA